MSKMLLPLLLAILFVSGTSCMVKTTAKKDNGKHKGWYKNRHNPHNPNTDNPKGKDKKHFTRLDLY
jgi:hypothetical protein